MNKNTKLESIAFRIGLLEKREDGKIWVGSVDCDENIYWEDRTPDSHEAIYIENKDWRKYGGTYFLESNTEKLIEKLVDLGVWK